MDRAASNAKMRCIPFVTRLFFYGFFGLPFFSPVQESEQTDTYLRTYTYLAT